MSFNDVVYEIDLNRTNTASETRYKYCFILL